MPVDRENLTKVLDQIRKQYGDGNIHYADNYPALVKIPTGSLELDLATDGGVPLGRWSHFYGPLSSGKTLTAWNVIKAAQDMGLECAYYNIEKQFLPDWVEARGIDLSRLHLVEGTIIEELGTKLESLLGVVHVHVLDSLAFAVSTDELASKSEEWRPGIQSRAWGKVFRRANERFDDKENAVIMINQTRSVFGRMGAAEEPTSGRAVGYISSLDLQFKRSHWLFKDGNGILQKEGSNTDTITGDTEPDGIEFQIRVAKSRVCKPYETARMRLDFESGQFDSMWELTKAAVFKDLVSRTSEKSSWFVLPNGDKVQGEKGLREAIMHDIDLQETIRKAILNGHAATTGS